MSDARKIDRADQVLGLADAAHRDARHERFESRRVFPRGGGHGVSITPGASAFTRTPLGASSCASDWVNILIAPFDGE